MAKNPTKAEVTANTAKDLRTAYLLAFDSFSTDPTEVAAMVNGNTRYGRELLAVLTKADLLVEVEAEDGVAWQVINPGTYDSHERDEAEAVVDEWLAANMPQAEAKKVVKSKAASNGSVTVSAEGSPCLCGCGEKTGKKSNYRPGHDARHAGQVGRALAAMGEPSEADLDRMLAVLPSESLRLKARGVAENALAKASKKAAPTGPVDGTAKVGKSEVVARRHPDGKVEYMDAKTGDWKAASKTAASTFQEG